MSLSACRLTHVGIYTQAYREHDDDVVVVLSVEREVERRRETRRRQGLERQTESFLMDYIRFMKYRRETHRERDVHAWNVL